MKPGVSISETIGRRMRVAELHEARGLVGGVGVDGAAEMRRIVGEDADRPAFDASERGDDAGAEAARSSSSESPSTSAAMTARTS